MVSNKKKVTKVFKVICPNPTNNPNCLGEREAKTLRKEIKEKGEPYLLLCKRCCQLGKEKTQEHRDKLSKAVKELQTDELRQQKSDYMKSHPELWKTLRPELGPKSRQGTHHTDEAKKKISEGVKKAKEQE